MNNQRPVRRRLADVLRINAAEVRGEHLRPPASETVVAAHSQAICVASGKGGTGKTIFSTNIGVLLAREGLSVTLVDADFGLANSHLLLGIDPRHDVSQLISGEKDIDEVLAHGPHGLRVLPGGSGMAELAELGEGQLTYLAHQMMRIDERSDITLIDCSAGITRQALRFMASAHRVVIVTTPEVTSMIDGYAVIKNIYRLRPDMPMWIVVNRTRTIADENDVYKKMRDVVRKRLGRVTMELLGGVPHDRYVLNSVAQRQPVAVIHPRCFATGRFTHMARTLREAHERWRAAQRSLSEPAYFWSLARMRYG